MEKSEIIKTLSEYIQKEIMKKSKRELSNDEPIISSGIIDSFSLVDLSLFIEDTFEVVIDDSELNADTFDSLSQLSDLIIQRQA